MPISSDYLFLASMDVDPGHEAEFNEVYDTEHVPLLSEVPGVVSVARFQAQELTLLIGGELRTVRLEGEPRYTALYEIASPEVLVSPAWGEAIEQGRWPGRIRPHTKNRRHLLMKRL